MTEFGKRFKPLNSSVPLTRDEFLNILKTNPDAQKALKEAAEIQMRRSGGDVLRRESGFIIAWDPATKAVQIGGVYFGKEYAQNPNGGSPTAHVDFGIGIAWAQANGWQVIGGVHSHPNDRAFFVSDADRAVHDFNNFWGVVIYQGSSGRGTIIDPDGGGTKGGRF